MSHRSMQAAASDRRDPPALGDETIHTLRGARRTEPHHLHLDLCFSELERGVRLSQKAHTQLLDLQDLSDNASQETITHRAI